LTASTRHETFVVTDLSPSEKDNPDNANESRRLETVPGDFDGDGRDELLLFHWVGSAWLAEFDGQSRTTTTSHRWEAGPTSS